MQFPGIGGILLFIRIKSKIKYWTTDILLLKSISLSTVSNAICTTMIKMYNKGDNAVLFDGDWNCMIETSAF